ncbi:MAG TPA: class I SAM-dependent methyltransferase [Gemmataceae bacterium]|nr:class I SAM-dependent methyltransferase [Gemmataceae bacterium]
MSQPDTLNPYQYQDLLVRSHDLYAAAKYQILLRHLEGERELSILNAGCGSGELSLLLAEAGHRVLGVDPALEYIELARLNADRAGIESCSFLVASIEEFSSDDVFDCVVATDVLEHIEDDRGAFEKLVRLVKPGGTLLITVPAGPWLYGFHDESLGHYRRYSRRELRRLVSPFCRIEALRYFGFSLIPVCYLYSKLLRKPYPVGASGDAASNPAIAFTLRSMLHLDRLLPLPLGISLILKATRPLSIRPASVSDVSQKRRDKQRFYEASLTGL